MRLSRSCGSSSSRGMLSRDTKGRGVIGVEAGAGEVIEGVIEDGEGARLEGGEGVAAVDERCKSTGSVIFVRGEATKTRKRLGHQFEIGKRQCHVGRAQN